MMQLSELITFAHQLADLSSEIIRPYFRNQVSVDHKSDRTPVTEADFRAEQAMRKLIEQHYPEHGILGEEIANQGEDRETLWILDPIDGTKSFVSGSPLFGTLIGLMHQGKPMIGLINQPILQERWVGVYQQGSYFNHQPIKTRNVQTLSHARFAYTSPHMFNVHERKMLDYVSSQVAQTIFGGDCYAYGLLASGHIDLIIEASLHPHDYMALIPVIENAGGVITDWQGKSLTLHSEGKVIAAANQTLLKQVLQCMEVSHEHT